MHKYYVQYSLMYIGCTVCVNTVKSHLVATCILTTSMMVDMHISRILKLLWMLDTITFITSSIDIFVHVQ